MHTRNLMSVRQAAAPGGGPRTGYAHASAPDGTETNAKSKLVEFIVHQAFYPVLMADRAGSNKAQIEHVQRATRAEIDRYRSYGSVEEVIANFRRDVQAESAKTIYTELRSLHLPVIDDLQYAFERRLRELGLSPDLH